MRRHIAIVTGLWLVLTVAGLILVQVDFMPPVRSDKGAVIDETFKTLLIMSVPVFTFVVATLGYSIVAFRHRGEPTENGAAITGRGPVPLAWFVITAVMAVGVMIYPGLTELPTIAHLDEQPDVVVQIKGLQWAWDITYPAQSVKTNKELVLPVNKKIGFEITSADVIHSVWVPAFRLRVDAVPNLTTYLSFTPTSTGTYAEDTGLRLQCSQLCGGDHAKMMVPVRVVTQAEFDAWVAENAIVQPTAPVDGAQDLAISAANPSGTTEFTFASDTLTAVADKGITLTFENTDNGVVHNIAVQQDATVFGKTDFQPGPGTQVLYLNALPAGTYQFVCQAHPATMKGTLEVK